MSTSHVSTLNADLRLSIAREQVAEALHTALGIAFPLDCPGGDWINVPLPLKDALRDLALATLLSARPEQRPAPTSPFFPLAVKLMKDEAARVTGLGPTHGKVIGFVGLKDDEGTR